MRRNVTVFKQHLAMLINPADKQDKINTGNTWNKSLSHLNYIIRDITREFLFRTALSNVGMLSSYPYLDIG